DRWGAALRISPPITFDLSSLGPQRTEVQPWLRLSLAAPLLAELAASAMQTWPVGVPQAPAPGGPIGAPLDKRVVGEAAALDHLYASVGDIRTLVDLCMKLASEGKRWTQEDILREGAPPPRTLRYLLARYGTNWPA